MTECNSETPAERVLSLEDAVSLLYTSSYSNSDVEMSHTFDVSVLHNWAL